MTTSPELNLPEELRSRTVAAYPADWTDTDTKAVNTVRVLAADSVQKIGSGHPGTAISLAPLAYTLYQRILRHDPQDPHWVGRDRFILSCGHSSLTQYIQLYLGGFGLELEDLQALRTWGSKTPGHPEYKHTAGVEITTGPLGQGLASAVGFAMAARKERGLFDPQAPAGTSPFDHFIYVIASDGDLQEGVTAEASSLAGTQELGNLIVFYDENQISIEDDTRIAFTEDVGARYAAYGWHVQHVASGEDVAAIEAAARAAQAETARPSIIIVHTVIAYPSPTKLNTGASHGSALGAEEVAGLKQILGFDPEAHFSVAPEVIAHTCALAQRAAEYRVGWQRGFTAWAEQNPANKALFDRLVAGELPAAWDAQLPTWEADAKGVATRKASEAALAALGAVLPELWGGSADLAGSNNTTIKGSDSFGPADISTSTYTAQPYGRTLHFGIREHAMGAILNGIALHGPTRPYGGTFLVFSDYMRPAVRLGSLMGTNVAYVWTHDSIGLGEDGPTHQPVEHLAALRAIPGLSVLRPADANETAAAWRAAVLHRNGPVAFALTRQNVPVIAETAEKAAAGVAAGAYTLIEASNQAPAVILLGSGSEVQLAVAARESLEAEGIPTRVVSVPSLDWFEQQDAAYREAVLPAAVTARVSVEAGIAQPWYRHLGTHGRAVSLEHYGASAAYEKLYAEFGITAAAVVAAAKDSLAASGQ